MVVKLHAGEVVVFCAQVALQTGLPDLFSGFPLHQQPLSPLLPVYPKAIGRAGNFFKHDYRCFGIR